jgi:D-sedoheptulose 7-phosphate isomerase
MKAVRKKIITDYLAEIKNSLDEMSENSTGHLDNVVSILVKARKKRNTVFMMGNGGSAATASHFAEDLAKCTITDGKPRFKVISLTDSMPGILAWANDASYEDIFIEQLKNLMEPGDVVVGFSGSGNSMNVIKAIDYANDNGGITIGISGYDGGKLLKRAQQNIHIPSYNMQRVEDIHLLVSHLLMVIIRDE